MHVRLQGLLLRLVIRSAAGEANSATTPSTDGNTSMDSSNSHSTNHLSPTANHQPTSRWEPREFLVVVEAVGAEPGEVVGRLQPLADALVDAVPQVCVLCV